MSPEHVPVAAKTIYFSYLGGIYAFAGSGQSDFVEPLRELYSIFTFITAWNDYFLQLTTDAPHWGGTSRLRLTLAFERGGSVRFDVASHSLAAARPTDGEEQGTHVIPADTWKRVLREHGVEGSAGRVDGSLPSGYHTLIVEAGSERAEALIIAAPRRCWSPADHGEDAAAAHRYKMEAGSELAPWVHRRLTGRSSGDNIAPKRPTLDPVE